MLDWQTTIRALLRVGESTSIILLCVLWSRDAKLGPYFKWLLWFLLFDSILYILDLPSKKLLHNNLYIFHISTFSDVSWLTLIFITLTDDKNKKLLKLGWIFFVITAIISATWVDGLLLNINVLSRISGNTFLVLIALRHLNQMIRHEHLTPPFQSPSFVLSITIFIYYSTGLALFIFQDLFRYEWFKELQIDLSSEENRLLYMAFYPLLRAIQFGLLLHLITLFPMGVTPRHALPRWLRFRLGWRPPTKNWRYRVLPPHLVG